MFGLFKKKKKVDIFDYDTVNLIRFDRVSFIKTYEDASTEDWKRTTSPNNVVNFIGANYVATGATIERAIERNQNIRIITITNDYFRWLNENNRENTSESRSLYGENLSDEQLNNLAKNAELDIAKEVFFIPVVSLKPITKLPAKIKKTIESNIRKKFPDVEVYFPGIVYSSEMLANTDAIELYDSAIEENISEYKEKLNYDLDRYIGIIPVTLSQHLPSSFKVRDILNSEDTVFSVSNDTILNFGADIDSKTKENSIFVYSFMAKYIKVPEVIKELLGVVYGADVVTIKC